MPGTILVTGASGLLGCNFVLTALRGNQKVIALFHSYPLSFPGVRTIKIDLQDDTAVRELIMDIRPDWIVHCAALTQVDWCETHRHETWKVNVDVPRHIAATAREVGADLIYISSDSIFDGKTGCYGEESEPGPLNVYAESKLAGELAVLEELDRSLVIRTNIYGWNVQEKMSLAEWMLHCLEAGQTLTGFYDIAFTPILVNDLSEIILDMMKLKLKGIFHVAGSQACSKFEFAMLLAGQFGLDRNRIQPFAAADSTELLAVRPKNTSLRTDKICTALGRLMPDINSGLKRFQEWRASGPLSQLRTKRGK